MSTYEYRCKKCGYTFEEFQSITADPLVTCPSCGQPALKRLLGGGAGMIFRGTGFYQTDYKSKTPASKESGSKPASTSSKSPKKPDSTTSSKTDK
jgi:putative FmdB family regulatory protein